LNGALQPYGQETRLDRHTSRALVQRQQNAALQDFDEQRARIVTSLRNEGGAILTGELAYWLELLGEQQDRLQHTSPTSAARVGHVLDQLAINGAHGIGNYLRGR
jgi:hypothetical protein